MKGSFKTEMLVSGVIFVFLALAIFYIIFSIKQNSLSLSLFGLFFILLMWIPTILMEFRIQSRNISLWGRTIIHLILVNTIFFVIFILILSERFTYYLAFTITYTLVQIIITSVKYKLDS